MGSQCASLKHKYIGELSTEPPQRGSQIITNKNFEQHSKNTNRYSSQRTPPQQNLLQPNRASNGKSAFNVSNYRDSKNTFKGTTSRYTVSSGDNVCHLHSNPDDQRQCDGQIQDMILNGDFPQEVQQIDGKQFNLQVGQKPMAASSNCSNSIKKAYNSYYIGKQQIFNNRSTK